MAGKAEDGHSGTQYNRTSAQQSSQTQVSSDYEEGKTQNVNINKYKRQSHINAIQIKDKKMRNK